MLFTRDPASQRRLEEMSSALISEGGFPLPTRTVDTIQWILAGPVERKERKGGRFSQVTTIKDRVEITLRLTDAPGGLGRADRIGLTERNELIKQLADSRGILYMFDPIREHTHGDAFQRTESLLGELFGVLSEEPDFDGKLPHHLAVCVTKLDDPRVFKTAQDLDLLIPDHNSKWGFPRVHEADSRRPVPGARPDQQVRGRRGGAAVVRAVLPPGADQLLRYLGGRLHGEQAHQAFRPPRHRERLPDRVRRALGPRPGAPDQRGRAGPVDHPAAGPAVVSCPMTSSKITAIAQWALEGKQPDGEDYRILACSTGDLNRAHFADALSRFQLGELSDLPQVSVSYARHGAEPGLSYLALAIHWYAIEGQRYANEVSHRDNQGRPTAYTSYFCLPYRRLAEAAVNYRAIHEALSALTLTVADGPPREVPIAIPTSRTPAADDFAVRVAPLLLTGRPVCVLGAEGTSMLERLEFIDAVMGLLPYGLPVPDDRGHLDQGLQPQPPVPAVLQQRPARGRARPPGDVGQGSRPDPDPRRGGGRVLRLAAGQHRTAGPVG